MLENTIGNNVSLMPAYPNNQHKANLQIVFVRNMIPNMHQIKRNEIARSKGGCQAENVNIEEQI